MNTVQFNEDQLEKGAGMLKAMAHPIRIAILFHLKNGERYSVTEIHNLIGIEQSATSHHLGILKDKGVLCSKREGKKSFYYLKHGVLGQIVECLQGCTCDDE